MLPNTLPILNLLEPMFKDMLVRLIVMWIQGMFSLTNACAGNIGDTLSKTPEQWAPALFSMIQTLSETVLLPIGGTILAAVAAMELIQLITDKNNLHDVDTWMVFKWFFKTAVSVIILSNAWTLTMGIFDVGQYVVNRAAGVISTNTAIDMATYLPNLETQLRAMDWYTLFGIALQTAICQLLAAACYIYIFVIAYGRMMEIFLTVSMAPIPLATVCSREWGQMGTNYIRALFALAFQGFLMMLCVGIYSVLVRNIIVQTDIVMALWGCMGYTVLLCFVLGKTGAMAKSILNAR